MLSTTAITFAMIAMLNCGNRIDPNGSELNSAKAEPAAILWRVSQPNPNQIVLFEFVEGEEVSHHVRVCDLGKSVLPGGVVLPNQFLSSVLLNGGKDVRNKDSKGTYWTFAIDALSAVGKEVTVGVKGLSDLNEEVGWNLKAAEGVHSGDAWNLLALSRVVGPAPEPVGDELCASGGPGATSCSQSLSGSACSVSCGSNYYACCYQAPNGDSRCRCVENK